MRANGEQWQNESQRPRFLHALTGRPPGEVTTNAMNAAISAAVSDRPTTDAMTSAINNAVTDKATHDELNTAIAGTSANIHHVSRGQHHPTSQPHRQRPADVHPEDFRGRANCKPSPTSSTS